jgi:lipoic acid synthetase
MLRDLRQHHVQLLTIGQYLAPTPKHRPVDRYVTPEEFSRWEHVARRDYGFEAVISRPLARSSFLAEQAYATTAETGGSPANQNPCCCQGAS